MGSPHFQPCPGARTGFVFISPGRFEAARGTPCAAGTGANLARALAALHQQRQGLSEEPTTPGLQSWRPPQRIVYVSCNPSTLARDAGLLVHQAGYRCSGAGVVNMFPHTAHVESMAVFDFIG